MKMSEKKKKPTGFPGNPNGQSSSRRDWNGQGDQAAAKRALPPTLVTSRTLQDEVVGRNSLEKANCVILKKNAAGDSCDESSQIDPPASEQVAKSRSKDQEVKPKVDVKANKTQWDKVVAQSSLQKATFSKTLGAGECMSNERSQTLKVC